MIQPQDKNTNSVSIEALFFQSAVDSKNCTLEPVKGKELCPAYYKTLALAADWHVVTAIFAIVIIFSFIGLALEKRE